MKRTAQGFDRLARLYTTVERTRALELGLALAAEHETAALRDAEAAAWQSAMEQSRFALSQGADEQRRVACSTSEIQALTTQQLQAVHVTREAESAQARERYQQSCLAADQMRRASERLRQAAEQDAVRSEQRAADDRFNSRKAWSKEQSSRRSASIPANADEPRFGHPPAMAGNRRLALW